MAKRAETSADIESQIEALQKRLIEAKRAEQAAADQELLKLVHKAGIRDEFIRIARDRIGQKRSREGSAAGE